MKIKEKVNYLVMRLGSKNISSELINIIVAPAESLQANEGACTWHDLSFLLSIYDNL